MTKEQRQHFLAERKLGIGGSDVAAIFGLDPWRSPEDLWLEKTGQRESPDISENPDVKRGILFEPTALDILRTKPEMEGKVIATPSRALVHPEYPWMRCNVDALAVPGVGKGQDEVVEVKCPSLGAYSKIKREGLRDAYKLQMQHNLFVAGVELGWWAIFCADRAEMLVFPMERDVLVQEMLVEREREFWALVETMSPPPPVIREIADEPEIMQIGSVTQRRDQEFIEATANLREAKELEATAKQLAETAKARVIELVGDKPGIYEAPGARIYYREQGGRTSFDKKGLAAKDPIPLVDAARVFGQIVEAEPPLTPSGIIEALNSYVIDLSAFEKVGKPFRTTRTYFFGDE